MANPIAETHTALALNNLHIVFDCALPNELVCNVCKQALRIPMKTVCNHFFCKQCLNVEHGPTACPTCQTMVSAESILLDREKHRQVQNLPVKCTFFDNKCPWKGTLKELQKHLSSCEFRDSKCPICKKQVSEREFSMHVKECEKMAKQCEFCKSMVKSAAMERHLKTCLKVIISCPFQCGLVDKTREEIEIHQNTCPNAKDMCPFAEMGCTYKGDKKNVQKHISEEPVRHLMILCDQAADIKSSMEDYTQFYTEGIQRCMELNSKLNNCNRMFGANLMWRITEVAQRTNNARSDKEPFTFSESFVTSRHGYKLIASCGLFGHGAGRATHLSVFISIVRGDYDSVLKWPFDQCVKFTLIDQKPNLKDRNDIIHAIDTKQLPNGIHLQRPIGDRNAPFGFHKFFPLDQLEYFVKEDVMFLRIDVFESDPLRTTEIHPVESTIHTLDETENLPMKFDLATLM